MNSTQIESSALAERLARYFKKLKKADFKRLDEHGGRLFVETTGGEVTSVGISFGNPDDGAMHEWIRACPNIVCMGPWQEERTKPENTRALLLQKSEEFAHDLIYDEIERREQAMAVEQVNVDR